VLEDVSRQNETVVSGVGRSVWGGSMEGDDGGPEELFVVERDYANSGWGG
jgi:hypothetical protein